ncbi:hypothetical protein JAAARDRAFT_53510 [Jaapia argillacea MUCL 33604]|uniref:Homeobox domain-containing protein n=1 Tax=Jaapia argillacea MUCL 33604 TaxID=933084 RepID=A0A067Q8G8_9AGAM|nr:hypothetical protein JAAARDRAFT_53510 [Jaapia argillacea MUCL 33604]
MDESIRRRLLSAEIDLLNSSTDDPSATSAFESSWLKLQDDIDEAMQSHLLSEETIRLAHSAASRIAILAERLLEVHASFDSLTSSLSKELDNIFDTIGDDVQPSRAPYPPHHHVLLQCPTIETSTFQDMDIRTPCPAFVLPCYKWLLRNIHNPYPSKEFKQSVADSTGCTYASVDTWFTSARRRIGWNEIAKEHFNNSRADMVDAATRVFEKDDKRRPIECPATHQFLLMKLKAEGLCADKLKKSKLARELDVLVKDMSEADRQRWDEQKVRSYLAEREQKEKEKKERRKEQAKQRATQKAMRETQRRTGSRRSPLDSRTPSPSWSLSDDSDDGDSLEELYDSDYFQDEELDMPQAPPKAIHKKRKSSRDEDDTIRQDQREKRRRTQSPPRHSPQIPSPTSELSPLLVVDTSFDQWSWDLSQSNSPLPAPEPIVPVTASRKRRLSDADAQGAPKRPRASQHGFRPQAVSNPLPMSRSLSFGDDPIFGWENMFNFEPPASVTTEELDSSAIDVEVFSNWQIWGDNGSVVSAQNIPSKSPTPQPLPQVEIPTFDLQSATPSGFDTTTSNDEGWSALSDFVVDLLAQQSQASSSSSFAENVPPLSDLPMVQPGSFDCSLPLPTQNSSQQFSYDSFAPYMETTCTNPAAFMFQQPQQPTPCTLPGFDISELLGLPHLETQIPFSSQMDHLDPVQGSTSSFDQYSAPSPVTLQADALEIQRKRHQLQLYKDAAQALEQELSVGLYVHFRTSPFLY